MKNQSRKPTKLPLRTETVRQLRHADLGEVAGGGPTSTVNHPIPVDPVPPPPPATTFPP